MQGVLAEIRDHRHHHRSRFPARQAEDPRRDRADCAYPVAFYVASPALMVTVLGKTDVLRLLSANLIAIGRVVVAATCRPADPTTTWKREAGDIVIAEAVRLCRRTTSACRSTNMLGDAA